MKKIIGLLINLSTIVLLTSCEGNTDRYWILENQSSDIIFINVKSLYSEEELHKKIVPNFRDTIHFGNQLGGSDHVQTPINTFSILDIYDRLGNSVSFDVFSESEWDNNVDQTHKIPSNYKHEYTLVVEDSDF